MYFLVNASPRKQLSPLHLVRTHDVTQFPQRSMVFLYMYLLNRLTKQFQTLQVHGSHDVKGTRPYLV